MFFVGHTTAEQTEPDLRDYNQVRDGAVGYFRGTKS